MPHYTAPLNITQQHTLRSITFSSCVFGKETARQGSGSIPGPQLAQRQHQDQSPESHGIYWVDPRNLFQGWIGRDTHLRQWGFLHRKPATVRQLRMMFACVLYKPRRGATTYHWYLNWFGILGWSRSGRFWSKFIVKREWSLQQPRKEENSQNPGWKNEKFRQRSLSICWHDWGPSDGLKVIVLHLTSLAPVEQFHDPEM